MAGVAEQRADGRMTGERGADQVEGLGPFFCANCLTYATAWRQRITGRRPPGWWQPTLFDPEEVAA